MSDKFNIYEAFEIAEQIERNGSAFYRTAAEKVDSEDARDFLLKLAEMEDSHESYFSKLKRKFEISQEESLSDYDQAALAYLHAIVDGDIFKDIGAPAAKIQPGDSVDTILKLAINFERNTVAFFAGVKSLLSDTEDKDKVEALIVEEMNHIVILSKKREELMKQ